jgi:hypothetical protein
MKEVAAADLVALVEEAARILAARPAPAENALTLSLVAATSHLAEGWREVVPRLELAGQAPVEAAVKAAAGARGLSVVWESPADVIPLPDGWAERSRPALHVPAGLPFTVRHFDPYSVVLRLVARGDEPDYVTALEYVRRGWVAVGQLESLLADVLPRFTRATLAQDPAEFRRKFRGLRQLAVREAAGAGADPVLS